MTSTIISRS